MTTEGSLAGVRVVDLSRVLAGPLCTQMLADHGAEVIKVEPPAGDETRGWGPPFVGPDTSAYFTGLNRNKRNVVIDLHSDLGREALRRLLQDADVLVENFKAGTLAKWGFDDEYLAETCPRLVHARITGFGTDGPLGGAPGYDAVLQAYGGLMSINGERDGPPLRVGVPIVDMVTGFFAFSGILLALNERHTSGRGQLVDCSLLDTAVNLLHPHTASWFADGRVPARTGSAHPTIAPYDTFRCRDGIFFLAVGNDRQFRDLTDVLGAPEIAADARFLTNADRVVQRDELRTVLEPLFRQWDREALGRALLARGVPSSPVHDVGETLTDPQVRHRNLVVELEGYTGVGIAVKLDRTDARVGTDSTSCTRGGHGRGDAAARLLGLGGGPPDRDGRRLTDPARRTRRQRRQGGPMDHVKLGRTGMDVSRIVLGCMTFGDPGSGKHPWTLPEEPSRELIRSALDMGINFFDTANVYSHGTSEEIVGRALRDFADRDEIVIATKVNGPMREGPNGRGLSRKAIMAEVDASLRRLGTDYVDLYQIHRWDPRTPIEETLEALHDVVKAGKVRYLGASSMYAWQFSKALYLADLHGWTRFVSMQNHYNLLNREEEREMLPLCADQGIAVLPWSPLARGRLARPWQATTERTRTDEFGKNLYHEDENDRLIVERVAALADERGASMAQVALAWMLHQDVVTAPIIGVSRPEHLADAQAALDLGLTAEELTRLEEPYTVRREAGFS